VRFVASPNGDGVVLWQTEWVRAGAQFRIVKTPNIHGTLVIADNARAFVGSTRLTTVGFDLYRDLGVLMSDTRSLDLLAATFAHDWNIGR